MKKVAHWGLRLISFVVVLVLLIDGWFEWYYSPAITAPSQLPEHHREVALVLGTSKYVVGGGLNSYYQRRIARASELYHAGLVDLLLVSGDNATRQYNEPVQMQRDLIRQGIPEAAIVLDYAGFRTLDSVQRAHRVFGLQRLYIISQPFHLPRALYLAEQTGIAAAGVAAEEPPWRLNAQVRMREVLARNIAIFDTLVGRQAKFIGPEEPIIIP